MFLFRCPRGTYFLLRQQGAVSNQTSLLLVFLDILCMGFVSQIKDLDSSAISKQKIGAGTFGQQLVIRQFLKIVAVVIHELIVLTPKIAHPQMEMICAILRQFFQNFETICNPSLYGVFFLCATLCHKKASLCNTPGWLLLTYGQFTFRELSA